MVSEEPPGKPDDEFIEIDLGDEDEALEVVLELETPAQPPPPPPLPPSASSPAAPPAESRSESPLSTGDQILDGPTHCPQCGFALRPLETTCPLCHWNTIKPPPEQAAPASEQASGSPSERPETPRPLPSGPQRPNWGLAGVTLTLLLLLVAGVVWWAWHNPVRAAQRAYRQGLQAQIRGNFIEARGHYQRALSLDPQLGLAAFSMGTTYLGIGAPEMVESIDSLVQQAIQGDTSALDEADKWFRETGQIAGQLPPDTRLMHQDIKDPRHLRAFARAYLALTALLRASAAIQADQWEDGLGWLQVAGTEAQGALVDDPANGLASEIIRKLL